MTASTVSQRAVPSASRDRAGGTWPGVSPASGHFFPLRYVKVCGECVGSGIEPKEPYGRCKFCEGTGKP